MVAVRMFPLLLSTRMLVFSWIVFEDRSDASYAHILLAFTLAHTMLGVVEAPGVKRDDD